VATLAYLAARLGGALIIRPQMVSPLWLGNVVLVAVLLLVRRSIWPLLLAAGLAAFFVYDLQAGGPIRSTAWLILSNAIEVLTAAFCLSKSFDGIPRLNSVKALVKYSFYAVFLAPFVGAFIGALSSGSNYWASWQVAFFSEALGFLTLMPAILGWAREIPALAQRPRTYYLEAAALFAALVILGHHTLVAPGSSPPALLYSLVPVLLWFALRFGATGVSTAMIAICFVSIWGAVHGRGPFNEPGAFTNVLSLQLFLFFTAAPFMALAALVEERQRAERTLRESEEKFRSVFRDAGVGMAIVSPEGRFLARNGAFSKFIGYTEEELLGKTVQSVTHPEDWPMFSKRLSLALTDGASFQGVQKRCLHKNGQVLCGECSASLIRDLDGKPQYFVAEVLDITERKRTEEALRESEKRFRLVADTAPVLIWMSDTDKLCTFFNKGWLEFTGRPLEQELGEGWASGVYPDDLERCLGIYSGAFDARVNFEMEYRLRRFDGKYRWIVDYGVPRFESDGIFCGYIGSCIDITDRKSTEEALEVLSGRLITAHEEERTRIARDLHDDFSQRLALLCIDIEQSRNKLPPSEVEERARLLKMLKWTKAMSADIRSLSHQLHSSKLDLIGLGPALMGLCEEMSANHKIKIEFIQRDTSSEIPKDVALCLFRIAQEALSNVVKHSQAKQAHAELYAANEQVHLRIADSGVGFDPSLRGTDAGIGLVSMRERLRLFGGRLSVRSVPTRGTEILAEVPLSGSANQALARTQAAGE
jgi:PAS domain S-box-containing protein